MRKQLILRKCLQIFSLNIKLMPCDMMRMVMEISLYYYLRVLSKLSWKAEDNTRIILDAMTAPPLTLLCGV